MSSPIVRTRTTFSPRCPRRNSSASPRTWSWSPLPLGEMLYEPGGQLQHAYFPTTAIVSLHYVMESGASAETAGVGNEGVVGISLFMGGDTTPSSAVVQTAGHAYRLERRLLKQEFNRAGPMQRLLLRYTQALITQMTQTAVCNRHHSVEQQLCRWLLLTLDRLPSRRAGHDAGTGRQHARRAPRRHHAGRRASCSRPASSATAAATSRCSSAPGWRRACASATPWSRRNSAACCPMCGRAKALAASPQSGPPRFCAQRADGAAR